VGVLRKISPALVTAISTINASIKRLRFILGANINAASSLDGNIVSGSNKFITTTTINGLSTISGRVLTTRGILPSNISATSTITAHLGSFIFVVPGRLNAASTLSGSVIAFKNIRGNINGTSTITGDLSRLIFHGPLITFEATIGTRNWTATTIKNRSTASTLLFNPWLATTTKRNWSATPTLPIRDWNVRV